MKITDRLNVEHGVFLGLLEQLDDLVSRDPAPSVIGAAVTTILAVIEPHCRFEDEHFYPVLREALGRDFPPLVAVDAEHRAVEGLCRALRAGSWDPATVTALTRSLRAHIEKEIHLVFPLAEEWIPAETLARASDWYAEHVHERAHRRSARPSRA